MKSIHHNRWRIHGRRQSLWYSPTRTLRTCLSWAAQTKSSRTWTTATSTSPRSPARVTWDPSSPKWTNGPEIWTSLGKLWYVSICDMLYVINVSWMTEKQMIYIVLVNKNISSLDHICSFNFVHWSLVNILPPDVNT